MAILDRQISTVKPEKFDLWMEAQKAFDEVEKQYGFPKKRYFWGWYGAKGLVMEREWASLAAMASALERASADPEWQAVSKKYQHVTEDFGNEIYGVMDV